MARSKKSSPPCVDRLNALREAALQEHASAEFLSGLLDSERHAELAKILKSDPRGLHEFQKLLAEFVAIVRDVEHHMVAHEFATYLDMGVNRSKAAKGVLSPELQALPAGELAARLVKDFMAVVATTRDVFYKHELAEILLYERQFGKTMTSKELKQAREDAEAFAMNNFMPVLKQTTQEQRTWLQYLEDKAKPKRVKVSKDPLEELVFGRFVAKA